MAKPTVRDIHEIVVDLERVVNELREATNAPPLEGSNPPAVPLGLVGLIHHLNFLEELSATLKKLIPEDEVEVSVESDTSQGT